MLTTVESETADAKAVEEHRDYTIQLSDNYDDLSSALEAWRLGCRMKDEAVDLLDTPTLLTPDNKHTHDQLTKDFKALREAVREHPTKSDIGDLQKELEPLLKELSEKYAAEWLKKEKSSVESIRAGDSFSASSLSHPTNNSFVHSRLKLDLPTFSGELLDWREFWHLFSACLSRETSLTDYERISCLENAMESAEAKEIIRQNATTGRYSEVVAAL